MPHFLGFHLCSASEVVSDHNRISHPICLTRNVNVTRLLLLSMSVLKEEQKQELKMLKEDLTRELEQQEEKKKEAAAAAAAAAK